MTARIVVAGTHSGVGKTTVATGLMAALTASGRTVGAAKVGPDYIDPSYHRLATGREPANLDAFLTGPELVAPLAARAADGADVLVVEGVMGLFDGASRALPEGDGAAAAAPGAPASTAHVAKLIASPVVLVVDAGAMATSAAALAHGYAAYDPALEVAGVVVNNVGSPRHAELVADAIEAGAGLPVLGCLPRREAVAAPSRHLGLVPAVERAAAAREAVDALGALVAEHVDLDAVAALAERAGAWPAPAWSPPTHRPTRARIGVAAGAAFSFAYPEDLALLEAAGAELARFDPRADEALPDGVDGLVLAGGFPEAHAAELAANAPLRAEVADLVAAGAPVRAECGGLLYLCARLDEAPMCAAIDAEASMGAGLTLGYRAAEAAADAGGWRAGEAARAHEFHQSTVTPRAGRRPAWRLEGGQAEGFVVGGAHASYLHTHWAATPRVAERFVDLAAARREERRCA